MQRELLKIVVLSRNEYDLIDDFLTYYSALIGAENIILIDNGSDHPGVLACYRKFIAQGLTVEQTSKGLWCHADIMTDAMSRCQDAAHFLMPLDTDEFVYFKRSAITVDSMDGARRALQEYLAEVLPTSFNIIRYADVMASVVDPHSSDYSAYRHQHPARSMTRFKDQGWDKLIVRSTAFASITQGNHNVRLKAGTEPRVLVSSMLGLLHFHETGNARTRERCLMSMRGYAQFSEDVQRGSWETQLRVCDRILRGNGFGGHRVLQYRLFVRKEILCREFQRLLRRLPSPEEAHDLATGHNSAWEDLCSQRVPTVLSTLILANFTPRYAETSQNNNKDTTEHQAAVDNVVLASLHLNSEQQSGQIIVISQVAQLLMQK